VNSAQCLLSRISPRTRLLAIILIVVFCLLFASAVCKTFVEDIAEESREEETYENLRKRLSVPVTVRVPLHNAGRRRRIGAGCLRNKRARASMHLLQLAIQSIQMLAKSLKQVQQRLHRLHSGAAAASNATAACRQACRWRPALGLAALCVGE